MSKYFPEVLLILILGSYVALELHEELTSEAYIRGLDQALGACDDPEEAKRLETLINSSASRDVSTGSAD